MSWQEIKKALNPVPEKNWKKIRQANRTVDKLIDADDLLTALKYECKKKDCHCRYNKSANVIR